MKGYVYILSNPSMPGLVKIGRTTRSVDGRAMELYQTGVPMPFVIEHWVLSPDCVALERTVHSLLPDLRVGDGREFFRCDPALVRGLVDDALVEQLREFIAEFTDTFVLCEEPFAIDPGDAAETIQYTVDAHPFELAGALRHIPPDAIQKAVETERERLKRVLGRRAVDRECAIVVPIQ